MNKGKIFKRIFASVSMLALMFGAMPANQINAYGYNHTFVPPFEGCAKFEKAQTVTGSPEVNPSVTATQTTYCLVVPDDDTVIASSFVKTGATGTKTFTYKSGYGGSGTKLRLDYFPTSFRFSTYNVYGTWKP